MLLCLIVLLMKYGVSGWVLMIAAMAVRRCLVGGLHSAGAGAACS